MSSQKDYTREELEDLSVDQLRDLAEKRNLPEIEGSGANGNVVKADLVDALAPSDNAAPVPKGPPDPTPPDTGPSPEKIAGPKPDPVVPVDQYTRRDDGDVLPGQFGRIEKGEHAGKVGVYVRTESVDGDGYPEVVTVRIRETGQLVAIDYADLTPTEFGGR